MIPLGDRWYRYVCTTAVAVGVVCATGTSSSVAVAQSAPPPLTPFRGLVDHVSATSIAWAFRRPASTAGRTPSAVTAAMSSWSRPHGIS
jgi:hypothetical protein